MQGQIRYIPNLPPEGSGELGEWLYDELGRVAEALLALAEGENEARDNLPEKPRRGMLIYLTGEGDDPTGDGEGFYVYLGGDWRRVDTSG